MEIRETILQGSLELFRDRGIQFTMDDLSKRLGISKKTIYTVFRSKEELALAACSRIFDRIKAEETAVMADDTLTTAEKIRAVLNVMPEGYQSLDFTRLDVLEERYPAVLREVTRRLETGWENTLALLEQGMAEGVIRPVRIPVIKAMYKASLEHFFRRNLLSEAGIRYQDALAEVVSILMDGILMTEE